MLRHLDFDLSFNVYSRKVNRGACPHDLKTVGRATVHSRLILLTHTHFQRHELLSVLLENQILVSLFKPLWSGLMQGAA